MGFFFFLFVFSSQEIVVSFKILSYITKSIDPKKKMKNGTDDDSSRFFCHHFIWNKNIVWHKKPHFGL